MTKSSRWSEIQEVGFVSGMRFLFWTYRLGGFWVFRIVLQPLLLYYFLAGRTARNASLGYLQRLNTYFAESPMPKATLWSVYRHFNAFANNSIDRLAVWADARMLDKVAFDNRQMLLEQIATGRGAVLMGAHLGNLEICRGLSTFNRDLRLNILVHSHHAEMFNLILSEVAENANVALIEISEITPATIIHLKKRVECGEFLAILADRVPPGSKERCVRQPFLGQMADFPEGPFILASLLECPVYTLFCVREGKGYRVCCDRFSDRVRLPRGGRRQAVNQYVSRYVGVLEDNLRKYPLQWFNFYPFWD